VDTTTKAIVWGSIGAVVVVLLPILIARRYAFRQSLAYVGWVLFIVGSAFAAIVIGDYFGIRGKGSTLFFMLIFLPVWALLNMRKSLGRRRNAPKHAKPSP
jgi:hypothetical protein